MKEVTYMIIELEKQLSKLSDIKKSIMEMGASLWQGRSWKEAAWIRMPDAGAWILGWQ